MSIRIIEQKLRTYPISNEFEEKQALREITQEVVLASLGRIGFFKKAAFQGGTCLRIFHGLNRFSEDLDFTLMKSNTEFTWKDYLESVKSDVASFGYEMEVTNRDDTESAVKLAFLKDEALGKILQLQYAGKTSLLGKIRITLKIDTNTPSGGQNDLKYIDFPYLSPVTVQDLATLFAGKIHALLCRNYVKGRDWYDFIWYSAQKTPVNYRYLDKALHQSGPWKGSYVHTDQAWLHNTLYKKIKSIDWEDAIKDVRRFIPVKEQFSIELWNAEVFTQQLGKLVDQPLSAE
jgi:predicted nucleotidyltransferase component of viral defense system